MLNEQIKYKYTFIDALLSLETLITLYFIALLLFGKSFTKLNIAGPLYLHDLCLFLLTVLSINRSRVKIRFPAILVLIGLGIVYFLISLAFFHLHGEYLLMAFRHFNLFVYLICSYIIFNVVVSQPADSFKPVNLIRLISSLSILLQVVYLAYGFFFIPKFSVFLPEDYSYFSPLVVFGIITYTAYVLAYEPRLIYKLVKFGFCLLLSTTLGHTSAFLAIFVMFLLYFFIKIAPMHRILALGVVVLAIVLLFFLPEFRDNNAGWRLLYWRHLLGAAIKSKYMILGSGFGKPFMTYDYALYLEQKLGSAGMVDEKYHMARYLNPPHNSLLTFVFHIGLIPALLIFVPMRNYFSRILFKPISSDATVNFLIYALAGCFIWISFNVILELPHSATFFWLVYFTAIYYLSVEKQIKTSGIT